MPAPNHPPPPKRVYFDDTRVTTKPRSYDHVPLNLVRALNVAALVAAILWIVFDPRAADALRGASDTNTEFPTASTFYHAMAVAIYIIAALTLITLAGGLFFGARKHRSLRAWLVVTTLVALWLAFYVSWRQFAWAGQQWRLIWQISQFERVADPLRKQWPREDSKIPELGYFTAYPGVEATTLLVIEDDSPPGRAPIAAVEHSPAGALRFQLAGDEAGAWLEWHPPGSEPAPFKGGLDTKYILDRTTTLGDGWFLSRYH
jgi:hypothetical protein